jgi:Xaa-Pro dipeptidase
VQLDRRAFIATGTAAAVASTLSPPAIAQAAEKPPKITIPQPIGSEERLARIASARALMRQQGIGAVIIEPGASLDYFTGVQWWRSERLTAAVIPAEGEAIIVTPFFERPSVAETLAIPAEIRTWNEDEEPLKLVADFLRERGVAGMPVGFEETNRFFLVDRLQQQLPAVRIVSANPVVRALRMIKSPAEIALMEAANWITLDAIRAVHDNLRPGVSDGAVGQMLREEMTRAGGQSPWALVLFGAASALPHGTSKPQQLQAGDMVLIDSGCGVHGYQADISRSFVIGRRWTPEQIEVWQRVQLGQQIAWNALKVGAPAGSVDDAVRRAYESWGYGPGYKLPGLSHRTGHGIGMEGHEPVNLVHGETMPLAPGMCFSNEPGLYLPGKFGVRLEDCFYMTDAGPRWFTIPPQSIDEPIGTGRR